MTVSESENTERVLTLEKDFDALSVAELNATLRAATVLAPVLLDFRNVRHCHPFALVWLFRLLAEELRGAVRVRGLCHQHYQLLGYLGMKEA